MALEFRTLSESEINAVSPPVTSAAGTPAGISYRTLNAPLNTVYDADNQRVVALPQTLSPVETGFVMKRDIDGAENFFAMQDTGPMRALGRGVGSFALALPQVGATLVKEQSELAKTTGPQDRVMPLNPFDGATKVFGAMRDIVLNVFDKDATLTTKMNGVIERNREYMAKNGWTPPEEGGVSGVMYDLGQGSGSMLTSVGIAALSKNPTMASLVFGAMQKASIYQEAREAGQSPEQASDLSTVAGTVESALEYIGLDHFMKALKGNTAVRRFVSGFGIEAAQEASQTASEDAITRLGGLRNDKTAMQSVEEVLYSAFLGGVIGGAANTAIGAMTRDKAKAAGLPPEVADAMGSYAENNYQNAAGDLGEFIDNELAPIAKDDAKAAAFITLMQKFDNNEALVDPEALDPESRELFNEYTAMFQQSVRQPEGVDAVKQRIYDMAIKAGESDEIAQEAAGILGARADAASRAYGITPQQWLDMWNVRIEDGDDPASGKMEQIEQESVFANEAPKAKRSMKPFREEAQQIKAQLSKADKAGDKREIGALGDLGWTPDMDVDEIAGALQDRAFNDTTTLKSGRTDPFVTEAALIKDQLNQPLRREIDRNDGRAVQKALGLPERPKSVLQYIRELGGISPSKDGATKSSRPPDELRALFDKQKSKLGALIQEDGLGLDEIYRRLVDAGYIEAQDSVQEDTDIDAVLDLIAREANGEKVYPVEVEHALREQDFNEDADRAHLGALGIEADTPVEIIAEILKERSMEGPTFFQPAYHGSPHKFDKFTLDHIGTGEGAQAYGWGLYFAGNKEVAEFYRKGLSYNQLIEIAKDSYDEGFDPADAEAKLFENPQLSPAQRELLEALRDDDWLGFDYPHQALRAVVKSANAYDLSEHTQAALKKQGQLYEVEIPGDDVLLDWDKPLSEQPPQILDALSQAGFTHDRAESDAYDNALLAALNDDGDTNTELPKQPRKPTGEDIYEALKKQAARGEGSVGRLRYEKGLFPDQAASEYLNSLGIKGIQYLDGSSRSKGEGSHNYVIFDDSAIQTLKTFYQGEGRNPRGSITFGPDSTVIKLFRGRNASTLIHELGHLFLRDMERVAGLTTRPRVKADYQAVLKFLGAKPGEPLSVAQEEKFARAFEAYLREGKAPRPELQGAFDRFKEWLREIYKSVQALNVDLSPEIRTTFDRMLGGDFARQQTLEQREDERNLELDYEAIAAASEQSTLGRDTAGLFRDASDLASDAFVPISTRLGNIDVKLKIAVRRFMFNTGFYTQEDRKAIEPWIRGITEKMTPADYKKLDFALKNRDTLKTQYLMEVYGLQKEWDAVRDTLDTIYADARAAGIPLGELADYFPRRVKPNMAAEYLAALRNQPVWTELQLAMHAADPKGSFTFEEQAEFANKYLRGFESRRLNLKRPGFTKGREIDYIAPEFNQYYVDSSQALMQYLSEMHYAIEVRKLFGMDDAQNLGEGQQSGVGVVPAKAEDNIGKYVLSLIQEGAIRPDQEQQVKKLLHAVVEPTGTRGVVSWMKNYSYVTTMGSPISALTQIQDLAFSLWKNGYWRTAKAYGKSWVGQQALTKEDIGLDNMLEEFQDGSRASKTVRKVFQAVGLSFMDNLGKETYMGAALERLQADNKKNGKDWQAMLENTFGPEAAQVRKDLKDGTLSENVKFLLFCELSDVQPISMAEMPIGYLRGGNGRIFYALKSYTIRYLDIVRREIVAELASGDPKRMANGLKNLITISFALMLMGMGSDAIKDFVLGREITLDDLVIDNLLKLIGLSKFQIYKAKEDGIAETFWATLFLPPIVTQLTDYYRDVRDVANDKMDAENARSVSQIPFGGKLYYWWWGGGREKVKKEQGKKAGKTSTP